MHDCRPISELQSVRTAVNKIVSNLTPLDIMLEDARRFRELASSSKGHDAVKYRRLAEEAERDAAPYLRPRKIKIRRGETFYKALLRVIED
jgi:hypothetical protein